MEQIKSKQRVEQFGEVFTPPEIVNEMLDLMDEEIRKIESRILEPSCGNGAFLIPILKRKLETVMNLSSTDSDLVINSALIALMSVYGIDYLEDNIEECRANLHNSFLTMIPSELITETIKQAVPNILALNIQQGDSINMKTPSGDDLIFIQWDVSEDGGFRYIRKGVNRIVNDAKAKKSQLNDQNSQDEQEDWTEITLPQISKLLTPGNSQENVDENEGHRVQEKLF